jgi:hypothetical protein
MTQVRYLAPRRPNTSIAYQRYYLLGLEEFGRVSVRGLPPLARMAPGVDLKIRLAYRLARGPEQAYVGRYEARLDGRTVRFAVDAHDGRAIFDEEALAWSEVYFKANRWPGDAYDPRVRPIVNGNGLVDRRKLEHLRSLRDAPKEVDVAYVSNVWGGREHSLRVFERLAALDCEKDLLAIFPRGFPPEEDEANMARLRAQGIAVTREPVPPPELWRRLARGRVVPLRAGKHLCFSWRTIDLLAMGACILFDALPPPRWPVPLEAGRHVADCGIARPDDTEAAAEGEYDKVAPAVEALLVDEAHTAGLRRAAAAYFDARAAPGRVAEYVLGTLRGTRRPTRFSSSPAPR